ncbi:MAG TPA: Dabb family protein [Chthoniobacterales bacterium]
MEERDPKQSRGPRFVALAALALSSLMGLGGCATPPPPGPNVTHVVLLWLKHPQRTADRARLIRTAHSLRMIPGVLRVEAGRAVPPVGPHAPRDFDLGVVVTFRDRAALERYEKDPSHAEAMQQYLRPLVRRYEVYNLGDR